MSEQTFVSIAADTFLTPVLAHFVLLTRDSGGRGAIRWLRDWRCWCRQLLLGWHDSEGHRLFVDISGQGASVRIVIALAERRVRDPLLLAGSASLK